MRVMQLHASDRSSRALSVAGGLGYINMQRIGRVVGEGESTNNTLATGRVNASLFTGSNIRPSAHRHQRTFCVKDKSDTHQARSRERVSCVFPGGQVGILIRVQMLLDVVAGGVLWRVAPHRAVRRVCTLIHAYVVDEELGRERHRRQVNRLERLGHRQVQDDGLPEDA